MRSDLGTCDSPANFSGMAVDSLTEDQFVCRKLAKIVEACLYSGLYSIVCLVCICFSVWSSLCEWNLWPDNGSLWLQWWLHWCELWDRYYNTMNSFSYSFIVSKCGLWITLLNDYSPLSSPQPTPHISLYAWYLWWRMCTDVFMCSWTWVITLWLCGWDLPLPARLHGSLLWIRYCWTIVTKNTLFLGISLISIESINYHAPQNWPVRHKYGVISSSFRVPWGFLWTGLFGGVSVSEWGIMWLHHWHVQLHNWMDQCILWHE